MRMKTLSITIITNLFLVTLSLRYKNGTTVFKSSCQKSGFICFFCMQYREKFLLYNAKFNYSNLYALKLLKGTFLSFMQFVIMIIYIFCGTEQKDSLSRVIQIIRNITQRKIFKEYS